MKSRCSRPLRFSRRSIAKNLTWCRSASPRKAAGWPRPTRPVCWKATTSAVARQLRAGDPEATPGAKLLHEGIPTLLAPVPGPQGPEGKAHRCGLSRSAWHLWRGRHHPGALRAGRHRLRRLRCAGLGSGHGQGRDEAALRAGRAAHRETRHAAAFGLGKVPAQGHRADRSRAQLSAVCEAGESWLVGGHQQGARSQGTRPGARSGAQSTIAS